MKESHVPSLVDLVPRVVAEAIEKLPDNYVNRPERDLKKLLRPPHLASRLRVQFWLEYHRALSGVHKHMKMENVFAGCCPKQMFYEWVLKDKKQVAWMICPPSDYMVSIKTSLAYATEEIQEILEKRIPFKMTQADVRLAELKVKIWQLLDERVNGAIVQKLEAKHLHANLPQPQDRSTLLKELSNEHRGVIDVDVKKED